MPNFVLQNRKIVKNKMRFKRAKPTLDAWVLQELHKLHKRAT